MESNRQSQEDTSEETKAATEMTTTDPVVIASVASIALSQYYFFVKGDREMGIFVGLWAPTWMALASYFRQAEMYSEMKSDSGMQSEFDRDIDDMR